MLAFLWRLLGRGSADPLDGLVPARTRLIIGLGNPGPEYADTRHNLGFRCVEVLAQRYRADWHDRRADLESLVGALGTLDAVTVLVARPQTFMNRSGTAVRALLEQAGIEPRQCLVVYDDMDLPFGALRLRERGSPGTHNGMRSVVASLGSIEVPRLRVGISQASPGEATAHVLSEFTDAERQAVTALVARAADAALAWATNGAAVAMNRYNNT